MKPIKLMTLVLIAALALTGCGRSGAKLLDKVTSAQGETQTPKPLPSPDLTEDEKIKAQVTDIVKNKLGFSIETIEVNRVADSVDSEAYSVSIYLTYTAKSIAETTKDMIKKYNNEIGTKAARIEGIHQLDILWEVPHLKEDGEIVKANLLKENNQLEFVEIWFDENIFE
ncbi:lipoprotein [Paenibacillus sp. J2TS4]|uniref:LptM family lipoprotein n=1 Tax=Paenibacillus sp. J2TS4 TaxID=2807194 RepID=UPI001B164E11|nr:hypothetical protein [Paenibacillus sp. J2TS4]GIP33674.1 hypothetical protein J2TS4_28840 [Paenibacillus sp. J2TS4]